MSWKLAELRWRHDIGLYESRWEKESGALPVERKKAIEAFEKGGRRSRSLSASRCASNSNLAVDKDVSLGKMVIPASSASRSSIEVIAHQRPPSRPPRGRYLSQSSLVPLLQTTSTRPRVWSASRSPVQEGDLVARLRASRCHSCSAFSGSSSEVCSPSPDRAQHPEGDPNETFFFLDHDRGQLASRNSEELDHLLSHQDSGLSSSGLTEKLLSPTPPALSQVTPFPDLEDLSDFRRDTLEPSVVEAFDNLLEFEGAVFELLNPSDTNHLCNISSPQDSLEARWTSTPSKHRSTSLLLPFNTMAERIDPRKEGSQPLASQTGVIPEDSTDAKPRTPKRRMTPIYDDYQTAVSMIRSGTPKLPTTPPAADKYASKPIGEFIDLPRTPNRRYSYSMTDVHRKLAESNNVLHFALPSEGHTLKQSATTVLPPEQERRVSIPVFPLRGRDSDDENEGLIARGEYLSEENVDNPAGIELEHDDIPLRDMELAQVRSRTRGDPVSSQEIHASSADFDNANDSKIDVPEPATTGSARASGSARTETSTIGKIVDQYRVGPDGETDSSYGSTDAVMPLKHSSAGFGVPEEQAKPANVSQPPSRAAPDVGPPPSWPLPPPPPALPRRNSKRRNSSGMLSSPGGYGNTSGLLNTKLFDTSTPKITSSEVFGLSKGASRMKSSNSSSDLLSRVEANVGASGKDDSNRMDVARLSHVSEESSGRSQCSGDSGWLNAVGYLEKQARTEDGPEVTTGAGNYHGAGEVSAAPTLHQLESASEGSHAHRKAENIFYPSGLSARGVRRRGGMDLGAATNFGSLDQILAGQVDSDDETIDVVDTSDWETIHDSRSQNNLQYDDAAKENLPVIESDKLHSFSSLSLKKAPVSAWDPLSDKTPGFDRSEKELGTLSKSHKEPTQNKQIDEVARSAANNSSAPDLGARAEGLFSLPGFANSGSAQPPVPSHQITQNSQVNKPKLAAQSRYRHPAPLQPEHKHPFTGKRPLLPASPKRHSTSSSDIMADEMYTHPNRHIESTSSVAGDSGVPGSATSEEEHNRRLRNERNRRIQAEIDLYDPDRVRARRVFPEARLTVDRRVRQANLDPVFVTTQRRIGRFWRWFSVFPLNYPVGGFFLLWDLTRGGHYLMNDAMLQTSRLFGNRVVAVFRQDDILWAQKVQKVMWKVALVVLAACMVVLAWALYTGTK